MPAEPTVRTCVLAKSPKTTYAGPMPEIVLSTLNAKFAHASFGLRYLHANLGTLRGRAEIVEFDISQRTVDILETLLDRQPRILGLGVYIWNVTETTRLVGELKRVRPDIIVILGGPEVSYETEQQEIVRLADYVVTGEADITFRQVCASRSNGISTIATWIAIGRRRFPTI